ncbi:cytochrome c oxidase assembly protein [Intrasporangium mesophilum]
MTPPPTRRRVAVPPGAVPWLAVLAGVLASAIAAWSTGAMNPLVFVEDAGPLVRWAAPLLRVGHDVAASMTFAALVFAASLVPDPARPARAARAAGGAPRDPGRTAYDEPGLGPGRALRLATIAGLAWTLTALVGVVLSFAEAAGLPLTSPALAGQFGALVWELDSTRVGLISAACAVVVTTGAALARRRAAAAWLAALAGFGIVVLGLASHTGTSDEHETSVNAMGLHLIGAMMWVGGLLTLIVLHRTFARSLAVVATRYSTLALVSFVTVGLSGGLATTTRLVTWSDFGTPYGLLIVVKIAAFVALGAAGWWHRRSTISDLQAGISGRPFFRLAVGEAIVMGVTFGVATALSRSAPPEPEDFPDPTPTLSITGFPAPPAPTLASLWTQWRVDWLMLAVAVVALLTYAAGIVGARVADAQSLVAAHGAAEADRERPGDAGPTRHRPRPVARPVARSMRHWPAWRVVSWVLGWLVFVWATCGAIGIYGRVAISWHLALQLVLAFVVAPLVVLGAPVELARRALRPRADGTLGPRELVLGVADSRTIRALTRPWVATVLLVGGFVGFHGSGLLDLALTTHPGHLVMVVVTLAVGVLWSSAIIGSARPSARVTSTARAPADGYAAVPGRGWSRAVLACLVVVVLAAFAAAYWLSRTTSLLAGDLFARMALGWDHDLATDQARAGAVALVAVPVCVILATGLATVARRSGLRGDD